MEVLNTILIINFKTYKFIEVSLESIEKLSALEHKIIICDNGSSEKEKDQLRILASIYPNLELIFRVQSEAGSVGHAEAMDFLIDKVQTKYFTTFDADNIVLMKDWDKLLVEKINDKTKAIGTPPVSQNTKKPIDFPLCFLTLFETMTYKNLNCSFMPDPELMLHGKDTAYIIREKFLENGYNGKVFIDRNTRYYKDGPFRDILCAEYYLEDYPDEIFCCHFGRGSSLGVSKYNYNWILKVPFFSRFTKKMKGRQQIKSWINVCKSIINN